MRHLSQQERQAKLVALKLATVTLLTVAKANGGCHVLANGKRVPVTVTGMRR